MKDYYEILNRKTPRDNWADSLQSHADSIGKPMNKNQAAAKAIYGGFAAGLRNDMDREAKIREIEEGSRQTAMLDKELKMFTAKNQVKKEKYNLFLNENYAGLMQLSDLMQKGEDGKIDILGPELFRNFGEIMGEDLGKFQHYKNGYFNFIDKKGEPRTINGMNLLQPLLANLPDDQKQNFKGFLTPLQMKDIDRMYEEKQLKIDKYRAEIDASKASVETNKAHAELYKAQSNPDAIQAEIDYKKAQANLLNQKATNVGKGDNKKLFDSIYQDNIKYLSESKNTLNTNNKILGAYKNIGKLLTEENLSILSRDGPSLYSNAMRFLNPSFDESTRRQAEIEMETQPLYHEIKKMFAGATSNQDVALFITTLPTLGKDYKGNMNVIKRKVNELEKDNFIIKNTRKLIEDSNYSIHHTHSSFDDKINTLWEKEVTDKKLLNNGKNVKMKDKDGAIYYIPKEELNE